MAIATRLHHGTRQAACRPDRSSNAQPPPEFPDLVCTLSWVRPEPGQLEIFFNRDEQRTRAAEGPAEKCAGGPLAYLAPTDRQAGGTWLAVNAAGIAIALLNGYHQRRGPAPSQVRSRGALVRDLAGLLTQARLPAGLDAQAYEPFHLVLFGLEAQRAYRWDGAGWSDDHDLRAPIVSSAFEFEAVRDHRRQTWETWSSGSAPTLGEQALAFHRHAPNGGDAFSPSMQRPEACSRSLCQITIERRQVTLRHAIGAPHLAEFAPPLTLARTAFQAG